MVTNPVSNLFQVPRKVKPVERIRNYTLLSGKKMTLRSVADKLHFSSEFYLSRCIRKNTGIPVAQFRQQLQQYPGEW